MFIFRTRVSSTQRVDPVYITENMSYLYMWKPSYPLESQSQFIITFNVFLFHLEKKLPPVTKALKLMAISKRLWKLWCMLWWLSPFWVLELLSCCRQTQHHDDEKRALSREIIVLNNHLMEAKLTIEKLQEDNVRAQWASDCSDRCFLSTFMI